MSACQVFSFGDPAAVVGNRLYALTYITGEDCIEAAVFFWWQPTKLIPHPDIADVVEALGLDVDWESEDIESGIHAARLWAAPFGAIPVIRPFGSKQLEEFEVVGAVSGPPDALFFGVDWKRFHEVKNLMARAEQEHTGWAAPDKAPDNPYSFLLGILDAFQDAAKDYLEQPAELQDQNESKA